MSGLKQLSLFGEFKLTKQDKKIINLLFFKEYFFTRLTGRWEIKDGKIFYEYNGESYQIYCLYRNGLKPTVSDIENLNISEECKENFLLAMKRVGVMNAYNIVEKYNKPTWISASNPKRKLTDDELARIIDIVDMFIINSLYIEESEESVPGCHDGNCLEKNILKGTLSFNSKESW